MQQYPLLQTKLYIPPIRPELVSRPRLIERLNAGLTMQGAFSRALTLVSAPAGFGKTTLVSEWMHAMGGATPPIAVAWLSLDEGDNDPARFLAYMIAALRTIEPRQESVGLIGKGLLSALQSPQPPSAEVVLASLINEIAAYPDSIILVLDDHHTIESSPVDDALAFLLERLPPKMHLVIASREDPHLPLARLRARGQLTELRATNLRFTTPEAAEFLNQAMGLDLSAKDVTALERRTEGWITGLHLAAISMQGRKDVDGFIKSFTGSNRYVLDYLVEEVLEQQPASVQICLLQTAILDRLTASLCEAVCFDDAESADLSEGETRSAGTVGPRGTTGRGRALLETLERANLFIVPLDEERRWYRYHHLFANLLRQRLRLTQPEWIPTLHQRASDGVHRKRVVAYVDIGQAEDWRWYWTWSRDWDCRPPSPAGWPDYILSCDPDGWTGNYPVAYWDAGWKDVLIHGLAGGVPPDRNYHSDLDEVLRDGFDGICLDWVEGYEDEAVVVAARAAGVDPATEMIALIGEIHAYATTRDPDFVVVQPGY